MKPVLCILIILASALIGNGFRWDIKRRSESLEALNSICRKIHSEISFRSPPLNELIKKYGTDKHCGELLSDVSAEFSSGFSAAWRESALKWANRNGLGEEEKHTVLMLESLGSTDTEGEKLLLKNVSDLLTIHSENARKELSEKGKMLFSCSMLAGLALVILII